MMHMMHLLLLLEMKAYDASIAMNKKECSM